MITLRTKTVQNIDSALGSVSTVHVNVTASVTVICLDSYLCVSAVWSVNVFGDIPLCYTMMFDVVHLPKLPCRTSAKSLSKS